MDDDSRAGVLLTVDEVALRLKLSPATVRRRIADGELPELRVGHAQGRSIRISSHALESLLVPTVAERDDA
jgi:excisionase family DNA binding protein